MTRSTRIVVKRPADPLQPLIDKRLPKPRTEESVRDELRGVARLVQIIERASI